MTTTDAAAAWHVHKRFALAVLFVSAALALSGCGTTNLLGGGESSSSVLAEPSANSASDSSQPRVAIAPIVGAPEAVGRQLSGQITQAAERQRIAIAKTPSDRSDYTLRGYMVAAKERSGVKLSYIWDLTDSAGKRVNRYQGEEVVAGGDSRDPWSSVSPQVIQAVADKSASGLSTALASLPKGGGAAPPVGVGASEGDRVASAASTGATGSINRAGAGVIAVVPTVTGAPGDGKTALAEALRSELARSGINATDSASPGAYRVEGRVALGQATSGKQPIQIDWQVKDPAGKRLGTVSQKNEIPQGSLDGAWGQTADAAAAAAAQGIVKLLPGQKSAN